jgi:hypothetical protein
MDSITAVNAEVAAKVLATVDAGLCSGVGSPVPGHMCVEAAVCYAYGLPHGDKPPCVGAAVRSFKIALNDAEWSSNAARAKGMRRIAIAQLGSATIDQSVFVDKLALATIRRVVPLALRAAAGMPGNAKQAIAIERAAKACESAEDLSAAKSAAESAAAESAAAAARSARSARDNILSIAAEIGVDALVAAGSPGCQFLYLTEGVK